jgi:tetratricopeptide (TPR) repeat protein
MGSCLSQKELIGYIREELNDREKDIIENHLLQCDLCFDAVEGITELSLNDDAAYHLDSIKDDIKIKSNSGILKTNLRFYISAAAVILIACTAALIMFRKSDSEKLFDEYFKPYPNTVPMVRGEDNDFDLKAAMILYNSGNYEQAISEFDKIIASENKNETALFYKGVSFLSIDNPEKAEISFRRVITFRGKLKDQAEWYLALSFLLNDEINKARELLTKITAENNYYSGQAAKIMKRIGDRD